MLRAGHLEQFSASNGADQRGAVLATALLFCAAFLSPTLFSPNGSAFAQTPAGQPSAGQEFTHPLYQPEVRNQLYQQLYVDVAAVEKHGNILKTVVKLIGPTVVHIEAKRTEGSRVYGRSRTVEEAGSGVILELDSKKFVLTNRHVVRDAPMADIDIGLADGRTIHPDKVWADKDTDVAVMAVSAPGLVAARLGDSEKVEIGDFCIAVGSPFGLSHSVTYGIISAKGRRDLELGDGNLRFQDFLQTDAAINPGNTGGPLISLRREIIGEASIRKGAPMATLEEALVPLYLHHRYQVEAAASVLGGQHFSYAMRGDGKTPTRPSTAAEQKRAFDALLLTLKPSELKIPESVLKLTPPRPSGYGPHRELFPRYTGITFDAISPAVVAADLTVSYLLESQRAARLVEQKALDATLPGFDDVVNDLVRATFSAQTGSGYEAEIARSIERVVVDRLMDTAANARMSQVRAIARAALHIFRLPKSESGSLPRNEAEIH